MFVSEQLFLVITNMIANVLLCNDIIIEDLMAIKYPIIYYSWCDPCYMHVITRGFILFVIISHTAFFM